MQNETNATQHTFLAACPKGIESLLADEIRELGGEVERETILGVVWRGDLATAYRFCLWSRLASRLLLPLQESQVDNVDEMYEAARSVDWPMVFPVGATFRIDFHGRTDYLNNTQFGAQKIKDAIVDCFREEEGTRPNVDKDGDIRIEAQLRKGKIFLYLNLTGDSLHRRGYRLQPGKAPLKENLAAAILIRAGWPALAKAGKHLIDPMCGSGTILIEAGQMAADVAPGLNRQRWGFDRWHQHDRKTWLAEVEAARIRRTEGLAAMTSRLYGFDIDGDQLNAATKNLERSGLAGKVHLERRSIEQLRVQKEVIAEGGIVVCNPPYGERLSELPQLAPLYQQFHDATMQMPEWPIAMFTANLDLARSVRRPVNKQYKLMNGKIETRLLVFGAADERSDRAPASAIRGPVEAFANRLKKNIKNLQKWANRENVHCYRLYDADLPEYAVAVDRYEDWLHVQEYVPPKTIDPTVAERRLLDVLAVLPEVTGVPAEQIVLKRRERQTGRKQYEKYNDEKSTMVVREGQVQLQVNLKDYLDTGLFLDHRPTRLEIAQLAKGKRFLNLFCYTATASVHAAAVGAHCTSVDMSRTYLNWGRENFRLNKINDELHKFIQADCLQWLREDKGSYDIIFMDPPTFSNSKRMEGVLDIQRDHVDLIRLAMARLAPGGTMIFSNNLRKFDMDAEALSEFTIVDVSAKSIPTDYARRTNIHVCYHITK
ncbi:MULTISPECIES: bifunctional 23S rRNA (guanine(2069)-N(7))-methyltransferase RlmK/23S rRNA (guanine(2445)-N(2))-methyltransferase RlmL [Thalassolituus]|uniref:bifunctional 23S rRNA (guanine(2069)-N(7))-methyltransferase RlmK/23S rRNA (guanine(2445)-N(2))-methyltransferase RlmL n=1 Tax=Thalassolituus TaxID=187492 RepID=UPI001CE2BFDE|nr:bifunctional 23S rRNA (guanine(2069)-N(7))-methyltransferase RlmK/23S rRNA (guanine(2445)-N(2))-methyltransferase RlmL [Thalassolituus oleivorans]MCA6129422.1 50S rRNA methyltransferase [Thalassolituus oleivorans 4BN06-13]